MSTWTEEKNWGLLVIGMFLTIIILGFNCQQEMYETERIYIKNGYTQITLAGEDGIAWIKADSTQGETK